MILKSKLIDGLIYSSRNFKIVGEEMQQYDDQFKMMMKIHSKSVKLLPVDTNERDKSWFEAIDKFLFTQKQIV